MIGGELGGYSRRSKVVSAIFLCFLWVFYVVMSALNSYKLLDVFGI
ncbi:MAG: hypothetical protein ACI9QD_001277 [Thermoproteota archaeon]|jgi:hypothetical protein